MQLIEGRIPLNQSERDAVDALIAKHPGESTSMTRRDPGETGPLLVHIGDDMYTIEERSG